MLPVSEVINKEELHFSLSTASPITSYVNLQLCKKINEIVLFTVSEF